MNSLRGRIIVLCALIALITATACAISTTISINRGIAYLDQRAADQQVIVFEKLLNDSLTQLGYEVDEYANWDDLYQRMPRPDDNWAAINLNPGKTPGSITQFMIIVANDHVTGRYNYNHIRKSEVSPADPVPAEVFEKLVRVNQNGHGFMIAEGFPIMYAIAPIRPSSHIGTPRGYLIAINYLNSKFLQKLSNDLWDVRIETIRKTGTLGPILSAQLQQHDIIVSGGKLFVTASFPVPDGEIRFTFSQDHSTGSRIKQDLIQTINLTGLIVSILTILIGIALGWWWLKPISVLADACIHHSGDPQDQLPDMHGLREAELLRVSFSDLMARLHHQQERLAIALDQQVTSNAVHRRFLGQLAHEIGQPIRTLTQAVDQLHAHGGRMDPAKAAHVRLIALRLEERLHDVFALIDDQSSNKHAFTRLDMHTYLEEIAELLQYRAEQQHTTIIVNAPHEQIPIDPKLLTPVLVNLTANSLQASSHSSVTLSVTLDNERKESRWCIDDNGTGLSPDFIEPFTNACARGEVMPGTPGFGLGLALAIANVRLLGGHIELVKTSHEGTSVVVVLPLDHAAGNRGREGSEVFRKQHTHAPS